MLPGDHSRSLIQRQRQMSQFGGHGRGAGLVGQAGSAVQQGQCLLGAEHVYRDTCPELRYQLPGHGDQYPGRPGGRNERPQQRRILHAIEYQQATAAVGLQPVPDRLARVGCARPGTADGQPRRFGHRGQPSQQGLAVPSVDPRDEPPAVRQPCPRVRSRQLGLARAPGPVSTTVGVWLARFSCAIRAGLGWKPGRRAGISPTMTGAFVAVRAADTTARRLPGAGRRLDDRRIHCQAPMRISGSAQLIAVIPRLRTLHTRLSADKLGILTPKSLANAVLGSMRAVSSPLTDSRSLVVLVYRRDHCPWRQNS